MGTKETMSMIDSSLIFTEIKKMQEEKMTNFQMIVMSKDGSSNHAIRISKIENTENKYFVSYEDISVLKNQATQEYVETLFGEFIEPIGPITAGDWLCANYKIRCTDLTLFYHISDLIITGQSAENLNNLYNIFENHKLLNSITLQPKVCIPDLEIFDGENIFVKCEMKENSIVSGNSQINYNWSMLLYSFNDSLLHDSLFEENFTLISHAWDGERIPDKTGWKIKYLNNYLNNNKELLVWDAWYKETHSDLNFFRNLNVLFCDSKVLILLDDKYFTKYWCYCEFLLSILSSKGVSLSSNKGVITQLNRIKITAPKFSETLFNKCFWVDAITFTMTRYLRWLKLILPVKTHHQTKYKNFEVAFILTFRTFIIYNKVFDLPSGYTDGSLIIGFDDFVGRTVERTKIIMRNLIRINNGGKIGELSPLSNLMVKLGVTFDELTGWRSFLIDIPHIFRYNPFWVKS